MRKVVSEIDCMRVDGDDRQKIRETIAVESQMQLIVNDEVVTEFLYSAGLDEELVVGYLISSGRISGLKSIEKTDMGDKVARVILSEEESDRLPVKDLGITVSHRQLLEIRSKLMESQRNHRATRGFHGAIIWELSTGKWLACEDIGRHNAVDKVIGFALKNNYNLSQSMVLLSGRLISDIVSKCRNCGIPLMASMTVATDGGIKHGVESNMTIIGALSEDGFWLYNEGAVRIT